MKFPRRLYTSVLLFNDNGEEKIVNWKIGTKGWKSLEEAYESKQPMWTFPVLLEENTRLRVEYRIFIARNGKENEKVFENAKSFFRMWKIHKSMKELGMGLPYDD